MNEDPQPRHRGVVGRVGAVAAAVVITGLLATLLVAMASMHPSTADGARRLYSSARDASLGTAAATATDTPSATPTPTGGGAQPTSTPVPPPTPQPTPTPTPIPVTFTCGSASVWEPATATTPTTYAGTLCVAAPVADDYINVAYTYCAGQTGHELTGDSSAVHVTGGQPTTVHWYFHAPGCAVPFVVAYSVAGSSSGTSYAGSGSFTVDGSGNH